MVENPVFSFAPIGVMRSCYKERFGVPRQAGLVPSAEATLVLPRNAETEAAVRGLDEFSHLWVIFVFHKNKSERWRPTVRPPRLGGQVRRGVLATRSPDRPNPIGLSVVEFKSLEFESASILIHLKGGDFVDGTPVLDVKPYIPYCDAIPAANGAWANLEIPRRRVEFSTAACEVCQNWHGNGYPELQSLIEETLSLDPRPASQAEAENKETYGCRLLDFNVRWTVKDECFFVTAIEYLGLK